MDKGRDKSLPPDTRNPPSGQQAGQDGIFHVFLVAGEASGDALGSAIMRALYERTGGAVRFSGIGGAAMTAQGLESLFPLEELSVMGVAEVLPRLGHLIGRFRATVREIEKRAPDVLVTIDSPDFSLRVANAVHRKRSDPRLKRLAAIHCVAPSVWAWRPGRAQKVARFLDGLICLLPFEPPYFEKEGLPSAFTGHPVVQGPFTRGQGGRFRASAGIEAGRRLLCLLPGSRRAELERTGPVLVEAARRILEATPDLGVVVPTLPHLRPAVCALTESLGAGRVFVLTGSEEARADAFAACDVALAASGTVGLELAAAGVPHSIAYRMKALSWWAVQWMVRVKYAHLVNILLDRSVVPEFLQKNCTAEKIAAAGADLLRGGWAAAEQKRGFLEAMDLLGKQNPISPAHRAADFILERVERISGKDFRKRGPAPSPSHGADRGRS